MGHIRRRVWIQALEVEMAEVSATEQLQLCVHSVGVRRHTASLSHVRLAKLLDDLLCVRTCGFCEDCVYHL